MIKDYEAHHHPLYTLENERLESEHHLFEKEHHLNQTFTALGSKLQKTSGVY